MKVKSLFANELLYIISFKTSTICNSVSSQFMRDVSRLYKDLNVNTHEHPKFRITEMYYVVVVIVF